MSYWFESCRNLANVDVSKIDTSNVRNMSDMFSNCPKLTNLNLSNLNTSNVTNMSGMFDSCSNLTSLNLSSFNTSNVTNMNRMFAACSNLTSLDLSKFNTSNVTDMSGMFNYCLKLTSLDLSKFNTSKVTNMSYMFYCCLKLTILDVSSLDTSKVTDMSNMFRKCSNLKIINLRDKFSTESLKSCNNIFTDTTADLLCDGNKKNAFPAEAYDYGKYIVRGPEFVYTGSQIVENNLQSMVLKPYKKDVKFDANGGTGTITIHVGVNDAIFCNAKYWSRMNICNNLGSFNDGMGYSYPTKSFYTFMGFFTQDGKELLNVNLITEDVYYAHWTPTNYSISYNLNGGSLSGQKTSYNIETANFTLPTPSKSGYTFTGWTGSNGTTAQKSVTIVKGSTGNKSYTAHWTPTKYTIGYTLNGGSISGQPTNYNIESANFTLPTPSKSGYTFTGWTGTGLSGLTKTVTVSKGSTGNRTYTAHFEKTVTATFKYYNNQTVTVTGKITDSATSVAVKAPAASGTPSGYTFRGWSTSSAANASVNAAASANVTISANVTYYASYSKNVTATFYYCALAADNYTYANGAQKSVTASATQYFGYTGTVVNSSISIPSTVTASHGGASAQNYVGVSKDTNSVSTVTPTTACTKYYAVYTEPLKFYYYNGTTDTSTSVTRRMLSNGSTYSNSLSTSAPTPAAYDGAAFAWWSYDSGVSGSSSLRKPLETGVNSLYAVYKKNVNISYNANGGSGAPAAQSGIKYYAKKESGSNIANPSITVTGSKPSRGGYNFSSWNTSANGNGTVYKAGAAYAISANVTLYAHWTPINWTIKYDANGGTGTMADTKHTYGANIKTTANAFTKTGYSFAYWNVSRVRNGKTEWLYANTDNSWISGASWYEKGKAPANLKLYNWPNTEYSSSTTYTNGDVITLHAQWTVNTLTIRYHNNGAQTYHDFNGNTLDVTKKDIIRTFSGKYNEDYDAVSGLLDVSRLTKTGYHSNGYWFVGSKNSSIKISDSKGYPKVQDIAKDAGVLDAFQKGNVTIDFYPDML